MINKLSPQKTAFCLLIVLFVFMGGDDNYCSSNDTEIGALDEYSEQPTLITELDTWIFIESYDKILVRENIMVRNNQNISLNQVNITIDPPFRELEVTDGASQALTYVSPIHPNLIQINLRNTLVQNESTEIKMTYHLDFQPTKVVGTPPCYFFNYNKTASYYIMDYFLTIMLPRDCIIPTDKEITSYFPDDAYIQETGPIVYLEWDFLDISKGQITYVHVFYEESTSSFATIWIIILSLLGGISLGAIIVFLWMKRNERRILAEISKVYLSEDQKEILRIINENECKIIQGDLIRISGFTKSKISRNLTPLEMNGFVTRERWGREAKVFLTDKGKKVLK